MLSFIALAVLSTALPVTAADASDRDAESGRNELHRFLTERAGSYTFTTVGSAEADGKTLTRTEQPVLRYTAPVSEFLTGGALFLWLEGKRPVAAGAMWVRDNRWCHREFSTLVDQPLVCRNEEGQTVWTPKSGAGVEGVFPQSPAPSTSKALRLTQMRNLARRFSATFYRSTDGEPSRLRLMPQPVYRYAAAEDGGLDAAVFVMAEANDPDLLVVVTARTDPDTGAGEWSYSLARMCSRKIDVRLDDRAIHTFPYYWTNPRTIRDPYCEALDGPFQPAAADDADDPASKDASQGPSAEKQP